MIEPVAGNAQSPFVPTPSAAATGPGAPTRGEAIQQDSAANPLRWLARIDANWREARGTAPLPLLRWTAAVAVFVGLWATGIPSHPAGWICPGAIVALMILPDAGTISFGGLKLELLRQNKAEIEKVGDQVRQLQVQQAVATASAAGVVTNHYYTAKAEAVADVIQDADEGENAKSVPAEEVLLRFAVSNPPSSVQIKPTSSDPTAESSLKS